MTVLALQIVALAGLLVAGGFFLAAAYRGLKGIAEARKLLKRWQ